jgi:hypothetical protein
VDEAVLKTAFNGNVLPDAYCGQLGAARTQLDERAPATILKDKLVAEDFDHSSGYAQPWVWRELIEWGGLMPRGAPRGWGRNLRTCELRAESRERRGDRYSAAHRMECHHRSPWLERFVIRNATQWPLNDVVQLRFSVVGYHLRMNARAVVVVVALALALAVPTAAGQSRAESITPEQAVAAARDRYLGELIDVTTIVARPNEPHGMVFEVKLLSADGQIVRVRIHAADGRFLEAAGHDLTKAQRKATDGGGR